MAISTPPNLPTFYYRDHFVEMLDFVSARYAHVLDAPHRRFIGEFAALGHTAQCLYARLANRKGRVFRRGNLRYPELGALEAPLRALRGARWVRAPHAGDAGAALAALTRADVDRALREVERPAPRGLRKAELIGFALAHADPAALAACLARSDLIVQRRAGALRYLLYLYFGRVQDGLARFTLRDLGLARTQSIRDGYEPRFADRDEALEHYFFAARLHDLENGSDGELAPFVAELDEWPEPNFGASATLRDKLAFALGRALERRGDGDDALCVYRRGESAECSERVMRLLLARDREQARAYLERCLTDPRSDAEWLVARDIHRLKFEKRRRSAPTRLLLDADTIDIDEAHVGAPEAAAAAYFRARGAQAYRTENPLWRTLFGLLFWEELFDGEAAALHSPFDFLPSTLRDGTFATRHARSIERKFEALGEPDALARRLAARAQELNGTANGVFRWRRSILEAVTALVTHAPPDALRGVLTRFCADYAGSRHGYPDLMLIEADGLRFVEIKAEGDQLRRNQMLRIEQLRAAGLRADVVRVRWTFDPQQTYVVVDVETTGGSGPAHRVTEIGAVKIRDGREIERFHTLLDPGRRIPPHIARLTGISDAMVAGAPRFDQIAERFESFFGDAIFVAHNVDFDYGFIGREFGRLGRRFRRAKLCTCAAMRKYYPGRASYSLAALTRAFGIALPDHHRALCDARAAAALLALINAKRQRRD